MYAKVLVVGDLHMSWKDYGMHLNYPKETMDMFDNIANIVETGGFTHCILTGDLAFGRFVKLEYRKRFDELCEKINKATGNNLYSLKGNHDEAGYGMTEYEYYVSNGVIKPSQNLTLGKCKITMIDYGKIGTVEVNKADANETGVVICHDMVEFNKNDAPEFMKPIIIGDMPKFFGTKLVVMGHIHNYYEKAGSIKDADGVMSSNCALMCLGSPTRPQYTEPVDDKAHFLVIECTDEGVGLQRMEIEQPPVEEIFNLEQKEIKEEKERIKEMRVDISNVIANLASYDNSGMDMVTMIDNMQVDKRYSNKAKELLQSSM